MTTNKAILIPQKDGKILIQDRTGHKPPPWGFFGGSIEEAETPIQGLIREIKEELSYEITESDVEFFGKYENQELDRVMNVYTWDATDIKDNEFDLQEGKAMKWIDVEEVKNILTDKMDLDIIKDLLIKETK